MKRLEWSDEHLQKFNEAVELFKDHTLGNKKIAKYMGDIMNKEIDPSHIRFQKLRYQKNKRKQERIDTLQRIGEAQA